MSIEGIASEGENKSFQHIIRCKVRVFGTWMSYGEHKPWSGRTRKQCLFFQESRDGVPLVEFQVRLGLDVTGVWDC